MADFRPGAEGPVRFGVFELDPRTGELRKHGVRIKLQDQPFAVLLMLLEKPGQLVTREELQQRLWPADTFVEFDKGIYNAMKRLRETLGDGAETPRYIETIPKRGYRFVARVDVPILQVQRASKGPFGRLIATTWWMSAGVTLLILFGGVGIWRYMQAVLRAPRGRWRWSRWQAWTEHSHGLPFRLTGIRLHSRCETKRARESTRYLLAVESLYD
jgi:DNA-binding winged helix-turn-helix (wHTH) protein